MIHSVVIGEKPPSKRPRKQSSFEFVLPTESIALDVTINSQTCYVIGSYRPPSVYSLSLDIYWKAGSDKHTFWYYLVTQIMTGRILKQYVIWYLWHIYLKILIKSPT